jgi:prefoldin subunit 5
VSCNQIQADAEIMFEYGSQISSLRDEIRKSERSISDAQNEFSKAQQDANKVSACSPSISASASVGFSTQGGYSVSASVSASYNAGACTAAKDSVKARNTLETKSNNAKDKIDEKTSEVESLDNERAKVAAESECARLQLNADYDILNGLIDLRSYDLEVVKLIYRKRALESEIESLQHQAKRLITEQEDAEQMAIDVEAARNDPNVRIYRNDAVQAAQRTFESARLEVYKATKVFEYYSSQSYPPLNDLFLVRMISRGNPTLEAYVDDLEDAFNGFEEDFGIPDLRVDVISVRDDLLRIPLTEDNVDLSQKERVSQFREAISDNGLLDRNGYRVIPFSLGGRRLSPLTRNHKISHIEAEFVGARVGDSVGRLYLRNSGTSVVKPLRGFTQYYSFPRHIAVINTFFNGQKVFPPELYQNRRLRDRPYLNSRWELIFNNVDEEANQDIDLNSLTDIKMYVYYRDFTDY